jgi:glycosyltransferase involved in cell wall biosynthesis
LHLPVLAQEVMDDFQNEMTMRVLQVFKTYLPDSFTGVERVIWEIAEGTTPLGVENHVFALGSRTTEQPLKIDNHYVHLVRSNLELAANPMSFSAISRFRSLVRHIDLVHYHFPWPMMDVLHLASGHRIPSLVTYQSDVVRQRHLLKLYKPLMHRFLHSVDRIVTTSPNYIDSSPVLPAYRHKASVIPIGLEPSRLPRSSIENRQLWEEKLPPRYFLFLGALRYYKGLPFLIEAAATSGLPVVIAGGGELPAAQRKSLPQNVHLVGQVSDEDKASLLALCEAFVFPSHLRSEAFGVALLEAAFAGKPLISCEIGTGTSYINRHEETGLVVQPANSSALATAMSLLWAEPELRRRYGEAAAKRANSLFQAKGMAQSYMKLYTKLLAASGHH